MSKTKMSKARRRRLKDISHENLDNKRRKTVHTASGGGCARSIPIQDHKISRFSPSHKFKKNGVRVSHPNSISKKSAEVNTPISKKSAEVNTPNSKKSAEVNTPNSKKSAEENTPNSKKSAEVKGPLDRFEEALLKENPEFLTLICVDDEEDVTLIRILERAKQSGYKSNLDFIDDLWLLDWSSHDWNEKKKKELVKKFRKYLVDNEATFAKAFKVCCMQTRNLAPAVACLKCDAVILPTRVYYMYQNESDKEKIRINLCSNCYFKGFKSPGPIKLDPQALAALAKTNKNQYVRSFNLEEIPETRVECKLCQQPFHSRCVSYVKSHRFPDFICEYCQPQSSHKVKFTPWCSLLPETKLSRYIQERINKFMPKTTRYVYIREISCIKKVFRLETSLANFVKPLGLGSAFPFTSRTLICFQQTQNGGCLAYFALYFHEHGEDGPACNRGVINLAMLDSVQLLETSCKRSEVFYLTILAYFNYMRKRGFKKAFLWSCPPPRPEVEYVFYRRPNPSKVLGKKVLNNWYRRMMKIGVKFGIFENFSTLYEFCREKKSPAELFQTFPYLCDDHWPKVLTEIIDDFQKRSLFDQGNHRVAQYFYKFRLVFNKMMEEMEYIKDSFYTITLKQDTKPKRKYVDVLVSSKLGDSRDQLIDFFRQNNLEFTDERKASYSTKAFVAEILNGPYLICKHCELEIFYGYYCEECPSPFPVCRACFVKVGHKHTKFKKIQTRAWFVPEKLSHFTEWLRLNDKAHSISESSIVTSLLINAKLKKNWSANVTRHLKVCVNKRCTWCRRLAKLINWLPFSVSSSNDKVKTMLRTLVDTGLFSETTV